MRRDKRVKKKIGGVKCIVVAFESRHIFFLKKIIYLLILRRSWRADAHPPAAISCNRMMQKGIKINKNLPQTRQAWIFKRLCNLWKHMQTDKANNTREDSREWRLSPIYLFYNRLRSLHGDAPNGAHTAKICFSPTKVTGLQERNRSL